MTAPQPIGLGVIGVGNIARACLRAVTHPDSPFRLAALCGLEPAALARTATEFGAPFTTAAFDEVLGRDDVEAVAIYSPDNLHYPMIEASLKAGKDVVVTKPMVISAEEAGKVLNLLEETGRTLVVGETSRFGRNRIAARKLVDDGDLGRIVSGETHYVHDMRPVFDKTPWRYLEPKDFPIGSMCHPISLLTWFLGEAEEVFTYAVNSGVDPRYPADTPDTYYVNLKFRNGSIGRILGAFGIIEPPLPMESLTLLGTKGTLVNDAVVLDRLPGLPTARLDFGSEYDHDGEVARYLAEFAREIREGVRSSSTALDAAHTVAVGEAVKASAASGQAVAVSTRFSLATPAGAVA